MTAQLAAEGDTVAGPLALLIILLLAVATVLLVRNMNGRIQRLPREFPDPPGTRDAPRPGDDGDERPPAA